MPIEIASLDALPVEDVQQNLAEAAQRVQEAFPDIDVRRGVFHDLVLMPEAALSTQRQVNFQRYQSAQSLLDITADPSLADDGVVEKVLSNYRLTRGEGSSARGTVTIVLSTAISVTIASGAVFEADGKQYTADAAYTAKAEAELLNSAADRLLTQLDDGNWAFTIDVTAAETGTAYLLKKDALLVPAAFPQSYVTSYATNDFVDGLDAENNTELVERLQQGIAARAPSNRVNMQAMLRAEAQFARVIRSSIVGAGDEEMLRDQHTIFPTSLGGRADWYIRTDQRAIQLTLRKEATLLSKATAGATWQVEIGRDEAPGFYEVTSVRPTDANGLSGTFEVVSDVRGTDLTGDGFVPDIATVAEGAFTRFQTAIIRFLDTLTDVTAITVGDAKDFDVTVRVQPLIAELQDFVSDFDVRSYGADVLVKAPVPCFMTVAFAVDKTRKQTDPDVTAIQAAVAAEVNNTDFNGRLYASQLLDVIQGFLPDGMSAGAVDMFGRLRWPSGATHYVRSSEVLVIESENGEMVSPRTVQFFLDAADVTIDVRTEIPVPA